MAVMRSYEPKNAALTALSAFIGKRAPMLEMLAGR
jgi:hypothetical protein